MSNPAERRTVSFVLQGTSRHLTNRENLAKIVKKLERGGFDCTDIRQVRLRFLADEKHKLHVSSSCQNWGEAWSYSGYGSGTKQTGIGPGSRTLSVGDIVESLKINICWRCAERDIEKHVGAKIERMLYIQSAENTTHIQVRDNGESPDFVEAAGVFAALSVVAQDGSQERALDALVSLYTKLEQATEETLGYSEQRTAHTLLLTRQKRALTGGLNLSWMPRDPRWATEEIYRAYCQTGAKEGSGGGGALKRAVEIIETSGFAVSPDEWGDVVRMIRGWDSGVAEMIAKTRSMRAIILVEGDMMHLTKGQTRRQPGGPDVTVATILRAAQGRRNKKNRERRWTGITHIPLGCVLELREIPGFSVKVAGRVSSERASEIVALAQQLAEIEGPAMTEEHALMASVSVLATGLEPALEGF